MPFRRLGLVATRIEDRAQLSFPRKIASVMLSGQAGDLDPHLKKRLTGRDVERLHIRTSEGIIRDEVFRNWDKLEQFTLGR